MKTIFKLVFSILIFSFSKLFSSDLGSEDWDGFGSTRGDQVRELIKALQANEGNTDISTYADGEALQIQSLERSLALLSFDITDMTFWQNIGKEKGFSTLEEYSTQDSYGSEGSWVGQLENAEEDDPSYNREFAVMKFLRQTWRVGDVLNGTQTITDPEMASVQSAMIRTIRDCNKGLYFGDSDIIPQQFDGMLSVVKNNYSTNIIDVGGVEITERNFRDGAQVIQENNGIATDCFMSLGGQTAVDNILLDNNAQRYYQNNTPKELGAPISGMRTSFGNFNFRSDRFLNIEGQEVPKKKEGQNIVEGSTSKKAPATPEFSLAAQTSVTGSLFGTSGRGGAIAGLYGYRISAINNYGKSKAATAKTVTVAQDGSVEITITAGSNSYSTYGYDIFRETTPASGKYRLMKTVKSDGDTTVYTDLNDDLPGTGIMFLVDNSTTGLKRSMALCQLAPMHRTRYAKIGPYNWGAVNYYVTPKWYAPQKYYIFKNVAIPDTTKSPLVNL